MTMDPADKEHAAWVAMCDRMRELGVSPNNPSSDPFIGSIKTWGSAFSEFQRAEGGRRYNDQRYAACREHAADALLTFDGGVAEIRRVAVHDPHLHCHCGNAADFYLLGVAWRA